MHDIIFGGMYMQATWSLLEQSVGQALLEARAAGMQVIIKEAVANGRLTPRNTTAAFADRLAILQKYASKYETTEDALALACVMVQPFAPVVLSGAATVEHLHANFQALELANRLQAEDVRHLMKEMEQDAGQYWSERSQLKWN
eukprot:scaffold41116_cov46-Prasinocladus_malaysianus.AAC.1